MPRKIYDIGVRPTTLIPVTSGPLKAHRFPLGEAAAALKAQSVRADPSGRVQWRFLIKVTQLPWSLNRTSLM